jgi:hypothetical protein
MRQTGRLGAFLRVGGRFVIHPSVRSHPVKFSNAVACLLFVSAAAWAGDQVIDKPLIAQSLDGFHKESATIREEMKTGGRYEFLKNDDRAKVEARMASMEGILTRHAEQNDLNNNDKIALMNAQEEVNGILKHNDANRLVCESRPPLGSNLPVKTCRTYGEVERQRAEAARFINDNDRKSISTTRGN